MGSGLAIPQVGAWESPAAMVFPLSGHLAEPQGSSAPSQWAGLSSLSMRLQPSMAESIGNFQQEMGILFQTVFGQCE